MAGGWTRDGAVQEQIEANIQDELARMKRPSQGDRPSRTHCIDCEEPIPEARRRAVPGVTLCIDCQQERDATVPAARGHQPARQQGQPAQVSAAGYGIPHSPR